MPIEREFKFVLHSPDELWAILDPMVTTGLIVGKAAIEQAYLGRGGRIRRRTWTVHKGVAILDNPKVEKIFTYKHDLTTEPGCLELEIDMSDDDFDLAWKESNHQLTKTRFLLPCIESAGIWEIDFFTDDQGCYLAMAEYEVSKEAGPPNKLHPLVARYLTYSVPEGDPRFKNRKLGERARVAETLSEIAQ